MTNTPQGQSLDPFTAQDRPPEDAAGADRGPAEAVAEGGAQVLLAASVFHYRILGIREVKEYLKSKGLKVNL